MTKWVIEYHYEDGDVEAHPANGSEVGQILRNLGVPPSCAPLYVIIRRDTDAGQALSNTIYTASAAHIAARSKQEDQAALNLLQRLIEWADQMGGWEAPVWDEARDLLDSPEG